MIEFVGCIFESLRKGRRVTISGFGSFVVARRAARDVRAPRNGNTIKIPSTKVPRFRPSRAFKITQSERTRTAQSRVLPSTRVCP